MLRLAARQLSTNVHKGSPTMFVAPKHVNNNPFFRKNFKGDIVPNAALNASEAVGGLQSWRPREAAPGALNQFMASMYIQNGHGSPSRLAKRVVPLRPKPLY